MCVPLSVLLWLFSLSQNGEGSCVEPVIEKSALICGAVGSLFTSNESCRTPILFKSRSSLSPGYCVEGRRACVLPFFAPAWLIIRTISFAAA